MTQQQPDFIIKDNGREYQIFPVSKVAKAITQLYKGVVMSQFVVSYGNFDSFQAWANRKTVLTWEESLATP
jgi:hypothetical protein